MPLYTYQCHDCHEQFELRRSMSQVHDALNCQLCGSQNTSKVFHAIAVIGSGSQSRSATAGGGCASCASKMPSACASCRR